MEDSQKDFESRKLREGAPKFRNADIKKHKKNTPVVTKWKEDVPEPVVWKVNQVKSVPEELSGFDAQKELGEKPVEKVKPVGTFADRMPDREEVPMVTGIPVSESGRPVKNNLPPLPPLPASVQGGEQAPESSGGSSLEEEPVPIQVVNKPDLKFAGENSLQRMRKRLGSAWETIGAVLRIPKHIEGPARSVRTDLPPVDRVSPKPLRGRGLREGQTSAADMLDKMKRENEKGE